MLGGWCISKNGKMAYFKLYQKIRFYKNVKFIFGAKVVIIK